jgi:preprotein translocase subunit SecY
MILNNMMGGNRQWIPLKLNVSGVMPIIFAQAIFIPAVSRYQLYATNGCAFVICSVLV